MKHIVFLLFFTFMCSVTVTTNAQSEKAWFAVKDGMENQNLMPVVENNTTTFLTTCNEAILKGRKPDFPSNIISIHVRTWQPDSYNGRLLSKDEILKLNDFSIQNL